MALHEKLREDLTRALKAGEGERAGVLRFLLAALHNLEIEKKTAGKETVLTDEDVIDALQKEAKRRREAIELMRRGGRNDLAEKEEHELAIVALYMPQAMGKGEIEAIVDELRAQGFGDFNSLMRETMARVRGRADGAMVAGVVRQKLS